MKVSLVVFEINEIDGLKAMMPQLKPEWYDELIVVDGGSTDGSLEYLRDAGYNHFVQQTPGVGGALCDAMKRVTGDVVVIYAPDGSFIPEVVPQMLEKIREGYDMVNVSRYMAGAKSLDDTVATACGNRIFTFFNNLVFGCRFTDFLYTYLAFRTELLDELRMRGQTERTWGQIFLLRCFKAGKKIVEIPSDEPRRIGGDVKVPKLRAAWSLLVTILHERFR